MRTVMVLTVMALSACSDFGDPSPDASLYDPCFTAKGPSAVGGAWTLTGNGSRSGCSHQELDTDKMQVGPASLSIDQGLADGGNAGTFALASPIPGFTLDGATVRGTCVSFVTREEIGGGSIRYEWNGTVRSDGAIAGQFVGTGPGACSANGDFLITIRR